MGVRIIGRPFGRFTSQARRYAIRGITSEAAALDIVDIRNGTFYRQFPSAKDGNAGNAFSNPPMFSGLKFSISSKSAKLEHWAIIGPSNAGKSTLLEILRGKFICLPPNARSFPYLTADYVDHRLRNPARAIGLVGFDAEQGNSGRSGTRGAFMSARYESRREETDFSLLDYLRGNTELNALGKDQSPQDFSAANFTRVIDDLDLTKLIHMPMSNLSNGQTRRSRIAKSLLFRPLLLLLDEPFMGLDPPTVQHISSLLRRLAEARNPRVILSLRPQDPVPDWITHVIRLEAPFRILSQGQRALPSLDEASKFHVARSPSAGRHMLECKSSGEILIDMQGVEIAYAGRKVLGDWIQTAYPAEHTDCSVNGNPGLHWRIRRGSRWGIFGPNGSGKTTLISLICSDHPLSYCQPIEIFGRRRLPEMGRPGISIFDIQARIGQSSPEIHAFFPRRLTLRQTLQNAWADTFLGTPRLDAEASNTVDACLRWFAAELTSPTWVKNDTNSNEPSSTAWADEIRFGEAPFSAQRVALFLRAIVRRKDIVVLDEAFSGMDERVRDKCMRFLQIGEQQQYGAVEAARGVRFKGLSHDQALICVSHVKEEVPDMIRDWIRLPQAQSGQEPQWGSLQVPLARDRETWSRIWSA